MKTHLKLAVLPGHSVRVLVVEADAEEKDSESSSRLRVARVVPEFDELRKWTESAKLARGA